MHNFGLQTDPKCVLCLKVTNGQEHLSFSCEYTTLVSNKQNRSLYEFLKQPMKWDSGTNRYLTLMDQRVWNKKVIGLYYYCLPNIEGHKL